MANRTLLNLVVGMSSVACGYFLSTRHGSNTASAPPVLLGDNLAIDSRLHMWVDVNERLTYRQAIEKLADRAGLKLNVNWRYLYHGQSEHAFDFEFHGTIEEALDMMPVDWRVEDGTIVIPAEDTPPSKRLTTRVYDVTPLSQRMGEIDIDRYLITYELSHDPPKFLPDEFEARRNELTSARVDRLIRNHIEPGPWPRFTVTDGPGYLIVEATPEIQARVERFIKLLINE